MNANENFYSNNIFFGTKRKYKENHANENLKEHNINLQHKSIENHENEDS